MNLKRESEAVGCQILKQTFFFLDLNNCIASPALLLLRNQPQMTLGRLTPVRVSPPPPCGAFSECSPQRLGSWLLNPFISSFLFRSQILFNLNFIPFQAIKICKSGFERNRVWQAGNRLPPMQIKGVVASEARKTPGSGGGGGQRPHAELGEGRRPSGKHMHLK